VKSSWHSSCVIAARDAAIFFLTMKQKAKFIIPLAVLLADGIFFYDYYTSSQIQEVPYADFYDQVEGGTVSSAKIAEDEIIFVDAAGQERKTQNPDSPTLKEFLLRSGVSVKSEKSAAALVSLALDIFFYGFFFFIIFAAFRKFISPNTFKVVRKTGVKFSDVVGMEELKRDMAQVMQIMKNPREWEKKGVRLPKGILLEGEPGNGKTLFAKALAGEASVNFIPAKATDFESMFMAIGPLKVKLLFAKARRRAPCIVFIDEFDGIGTRRNYSGSAIETENTRIVTALLNELDGFEPTKGVLVVAATNSVQALDPALIRPGRFDARFKVPYPDESARVSLVQKYTQAKKRAASCSDQKLAQLFEGFSCAKIESVLNKAALLASQAGRSEFTLDDIEAAAARVD
ncbi:MAG: ATP-dependent metallopeptidase FtsH/Yme1/Tma family protein, partial [Treponema sp.]|nr:ATP-dependent metallopeptidase FtsH/Yme1/Tma family protein [Treponema sp.]